MADLNISEREVLERLLQMGNGYVLDFSNQRFFDFVRESTGRNIDDSPYVGSKANRLRQFWEREPNYVVGRLLDDLLAYYRRTRHADLASDQETAFLFSECQQIAARLKKSAPVEGIEAITPEDGDREFETLAEAVRQAIQNDKPQEALDRLHTYVLRFIRRVAERHGIAVDKNKSLDSIFGEYVRALREAGLIESEMTGQVLKSAIRIMESFNRVRNERSLAHDNPLLDRDESLLILGVVCSTVRFIKALETRAASDSAGAVREPAEETPFW